MLVCMEMLLMSVACIWAFSYKEYITDIETNHG